MSFTCSNGSIKKPTAPIFAFIDATSWVCEVFPDGNNPLKNICIFFTEIADFLSTNPLELVAAAFIGFLNAQGDAVILDEFCSVNPPIPMDEINAIDVANALLLLPFDSVGVDTYAVNLLQQKICNAVAIQKWHQYCKCNLPEPIPPEPDPPNPLPTPFPPAPSPPCPSGTFTIIGNQIWLGANGIYDVPVCMTLPSNVGWNYQQTGSSGWVVYNATYSNAWSTPTGIGMDDNGYRPLPQFEGDIDPFIFKMPDSVSPAQIFIQGSTFFDENGVLNQNSPIYVPFQDGGGNLFMFRTVIWSSLTVACEYDCTEIFNDFGGSRPEPDVDACDLAEELCKPKHDCKLKQVNVETMDGCGNTFGATRTIQYGSCGSETIFVDSMDGCETTVKTLILLTPANGDGGGGLN